MLMVELPMDKVMEAGMSDVLLIHFCANAARIASAVV